MTESDDLPPKSSPSKKVRWLDLETKEELDWETKEGLDLYTKEEPEFHYNALESGDYEDMHDVKMEVKEERSSLGLVDYDDTTSEEESDFGDVEMEFKPEPIETTANVADTHVSSSLGSLCRSAFATIDGLDYDPFDPANEDRLLNLDDDFTGGYQENMDMDVDAIGGNLFVDTTDPEIRASHGTQEENLEDVLAFLEQPENGRRKARKRPAREITNEEVDRVIDEIMYGEEASSRRVASPEPRRYSRPTTPIPVPPLAEVVDVIDLEDDYKEPKKKKVRTTKRRRIRRNYKLAQTVPGGQEEKPYEYYDSIGCLVQTQEPIKRIEGGGALDKKRLLRLLAMEEAESDEPVEVVQKKETLLHQAKIMHKMRRFLREKKMEMADEERKLPINPIQHMIHVSRHPFLVSGSSDCFMYNFAAASQLGVASKAAPPLSAFFELGYRGYVAHKLIQEGKVMADELDCLSNRAKKKNEAGEEPSALRLVKQKLLQMQQAKEAAQRQVVEAPVAEKVVEDVPIRPAHVVSKKVPVVEAVAEKEVIAQMATTPVTQEPILPELSPSPPPSAVYEQPPQEEQPQENQGMADWANDADDLFYDF